MTRGGRRAGAGRPRAPLTPPATALSRVAAHYAMIAGVKLVQAARDLSEITGVPVSDHSVYAAWSLIYPGVKTSGRRMGICHSRSPSQRAVEWMLDQGCTPLAAAQRFGVTRQAVRFEWRRTYSESPTLGQLRAADRHAAIARAVKQVVEGRVSISSASKFEGCSVSGLYNALACLRGN